MYSPEAIYDGTLYCVPEAWDAMDALGDECTRLAKLPIALAVMLPAPPEFDELFQNRRKHGTRCV